MNAGYVFHCFSLICSCMSSKYINKSFFVFLKELYRQLKFVCKTNFECSSVSLWIKYMSTCSLIVETVILQQYHFISRNTPTLSFNMSYHCMCH